MLITMLPGDKDGRRCHKNNSPGRRVAGEWGTQSLISVSDDVQVSMSDNGLIVVPSSSGKHSSAFDISQISKETLDVERMEGEKCT